MSPAAATIHDPYAMRSAGRELLSLGLIDQIGGPRGESCWAHSGFWGTTVVHCPRSDVTIALTVNQASGFDRPSQEFASKVLRLVR